MLEQESGAGGGHRLVTDGQFGRTPAAPELIEALRDLQARRLQYIRSVNRIDNAACALVRRYLGWRYDLPEKERGGLNKRAKAVVTALYDGEEITEGDREIAAIVAPDIEAYRQARAPLVKARTEIEKTMRKLAHQLPAWAWVEGVRGFGDLALAVIVAEAGDLTGYPDRHRLWKRFGLTPHAGAAASTWRRKGGLKAEDWETIGYKPARNAESYAVLGDPLFRAQAMKADKTTGEVLREPGPYRLVYDREKARFLAAEKTKLHAHMHGLRCMRKAAIEDLWRVWNGGAAKERPGGGQTPFTDGHSTITPAGAA